MNIFVLHSDPSIAAQMMASALRRHGATDEQMPLTKAGTPYKGGYAHHPCTVWAGDSMGNYQWLAAHAIALCQEYIIRFGKSHACEAPIMRMDSMDVFIKPHHERMTPFALAMPDEYRPEPIDGEVVYHAYPEHAVKAYRRYYHSKQFAKWEKGTPAPDWWRGVEVTA